MASVGSNSDDEIVTTLVGRSVIFTGTLYVRGGRVKREDAIRLAREHGAVVSENPRAKVSRFTDLLVRGESQLWRDGAYGDDETQVAELQAAGHAVRIIDASGFESLINGGTATVIAPHADAARPLQSESPKPAANDAASPARSVHQAGESLIPPPESARPPSVMPATAPSELAATSVWQKLRAWIARLRHRGS